MPDFTLGQGRRYRATLTLGWLEQIAGNDRIAAELAKAGFSEINVQGDGETRIAHGVWTRESQAVALPEQVAELVEVV